MQEFRISEEGYRKYKRKALIGTLIGAAIVLCFMVGSNMSDFDRYGISSVIIFAVVAAIYLGFVFFRTFRKQQKMMQSYVLRISDTEIVREQWKMPDLTISFMEVKSIARLKKGGFVIHGLTSNDVITVPVWVERLDEVEERLTRFGEVLEGVKDPLGVRKRIGVMLLIWAAAIVALVVDNKWLVLVCGLFAATGLGVAFYKVRMNKNAPASLRRSSWFYLYFIAILLLMVFFKVGGMSLVR